MPPLLAIPLHVYLQVLKRNRKQINWCLLDVCVPSSLAVGLVCFFVYGSRSGTIVKNGIEQLVIHLSIAYP